MLKRKPWSDGKTVAHALSSHVMFSVVLKHDVYAVVTGRGLGSIVTLAAKHSFHVTSLNREADAEQRDDPQFSH